MGGEPDAIPERYESVRALSLVHKVRQPVLLVHGTADMRVPSDHSARLEQEMRRSGNGRVRLELVPGMGHYLELATAGYQFDRVCDLIAGWLCEVLA
jgi:dipeptidyl aminopeptidase/acylaminoacyl peptidase